MFEVTVEAGGTATVFRVDTVERVRALRRGREAALQAIGVTDSRWTSRLSN